MKTIEMDNLPKCNFCSKEAKYDVPTRVGGSWAYMCQEHFDTHASLDAGRFGTRLSKRTLKVIVKPEKTKSVVVPLTTDSVATIKCPYCRTSRSVEPDANYTVKCEGCGYEYEIRSII